MKKYLIFLMTAAAVFVSCGQDNLLPEDETIQQTPITFNLTANHPDATKAVKTGWEEGDAIFVFFNNVAAPKHLKMTYNGASWASAEYNGATQTDGALGLKNGDTGTMRAVFLPFGSNATVSADGTSFVFSTTYYAYYLTATLEYTVTNNKVIGAFNMTIPDDYVQFFIEDGDATDEAYTLGTDAVIPVGVASIAADGTITETTDKEAKDDLPGYAYEGYTYDNKETKGYLFSGKLTSWSYGSNYYFAKTKVESDPADNTRADLFVKPDNALASHGAVKLPDQYSDRWVNVGDGITVDMGYELGTWYTCNYGATAPEDLGTKLNWADAVGAAGTLPSQSVFYNFSLDRMLAECTWIAIHGKEGLVMKSKDGNGFFFLPKTDDDEGNYWSSTDCDSDFAVCLVCDSDGYCNPHDHYKGDECGVRFLQN